MRRPNEVEYNKASLMGNWYEERLAPKQAQRDPNASKNLRQIEEGISIPGDNGCLLHLPRVSRNPAYITKEIIVPDDGYREFRSEQQTKFDAVNIRNLQMRDCRPLVKANGSKTVYAESNPTVAQTGGATMIQQINQHNIHQIMVDRPVHSNFTDFGSTFKAHPEQHGKLYSVTTYQQSFQPPSSEVKDVLPKPPKKDKACGYREKSEFETGLKMTSVLTGERFRCEQDPKDNTGIQRAWLPTEDPSLQVAKDNLTKTDLNCYKQKTNQAHDYDIATSLPLGDGMYTLHSKYTDPGQFRHVRTDVTIIRNKPITRK